MRTIAELRASKVNPRNGRRVYADDLDGKKIVITGATYLPSLFGPESNAGGFHEYLILNLHIKFDPKQEDLWFQTQAIDIFRLFKGVPADFFPFEGEFKIKELGEGQSAFIIE